MHKALAGLVAGLMVVVAGCGVFGGEEDEAKQAIADSLMRSDGGTGMMSLEREDAECLADRMVDGIGLDRLKEYGLLREDGTVNENQDFTTIEMSTEDAETTVDALFRCTDVMRVVREQMAQTPGAKDPEVQRCLERAVSEQLVRKVLVGMFSGQGSAVGGKLMRPAMRCLMRGVEVPKN
jgi:hypothetical protein